MCFEFQRENPRQSLVVIRAVATKQGDLNCQSVREVLSQERLWYSDRLPLRCMEDSETTVCFLESTEDILSNLPFLVTSVLVVDVSAAAGWADLGTATILYQGTSSGYVLSVANEIALLASKLPVRRTARVGKSPV